MSQKAIKITRDGIESKCMPSSLPLLRSHGWTAVEDGSSGELPAIALIEWSNDVETPEPDPTETKE